MNRETFIREFEAMLDLSQGQLQLQEQLSGYHSWDSMTQLTLIAFIDNHFQYTLELTEMEKIKTTHDILKILKPYLTTDTQ